MVNPIDFKGKSYIVNGRRLLCRGCKSDSHLIPNCPKVNKPRLVYAIMQNYADANESVFYGASLDDILNEVQNLSDDSWADISSEVMDSSENDSEIAEAQCNSLCHWADQHDVMRSKFVPSFR